MYITSVSYPLVLGDIANQLSRSFIRQFLVDRRRKDTQPRPVLHHHPSSLWQRPVLIPFEPTEYHPISKMLFL